MRTTDLRVALLMALVPLMLPTPGVGQEGGAQRLSLSQGGLHYEVVGSGDPVVVVHGGPGLDHAYLRPGMDVLAESRALVYYDQRGTGASDVPVHPDLINIDEFVADIDRIREALGRDRITVLGHSFGGLIALAYAFAYPQRVEALLLLNSVEPGPRWRDEAAQRAADARTPEDAADLQEITSSTAFAERDPAALSRLYQVAFRGTLRDRNRVGELNLELTPATAQNGPDVAMLLGQSMGEVDWWDDLAGLDVPTLVVHGRFDPTPIAMAEALAAAMPNGQLALLDSGHFPFMEVPQELARVVGDFLANVGR